MLSEMEKAFLPTEEEIKAHEKTGYHIKSKILPGELFEMAYKAGMAFLRGGRDAGSPEVIGPANTSPTDQTVLMNDGSASLQMKGIGAIVTTLYSQFFGLSHLQRKGGF